MKNIGFDHCVIAVGNWERSDAFYREVLEAEIPEHGAEWGQYLFSGWHLNVHGPQGIGGIKARHPVEPGNSDLCFIWPGPIEEAITHLQEHQVPIELGPLEVPSDKGQHIYFRDPDGSLLEFVSYPNAQV